MDGIKIVPSADYDWTIFVPYKESEQSKPWDTTESSVQVQVGKDSVYVPRQGELNVDGLKALRLALTIAEGILERGYESNE